jgi:hypothetical protein
MSRKPPRRLPPSRPRDDDSDRSIDRYNYRGNDDYGSSGYGDEYGDRQRRERNPMDRDRPDRDRQDWGDRSAEKAEKKGFFNWNTIAALLAVLMIGIAVGVGMSSAVPTGGSGNVATSYDIDTSVQNREICAQYGASAITTDMRVFVTLRPFSVFVTQPRMQPGCVLRNSNWNILESRGLLNSEGLKNCRNRLNTFAFTGDIERKDGKTQVDCVYQNDRAGNLFQPSNSNTPEEADKF